MKKRPFRWILLGALVAACVFVPTVGLLLPEEYRASGRVDLALSPDELWERLADVERYPMCASTTASVERVPDVEGRPAWIEDLGSARLRHVTVASEQPRRLVREATDEVVPMSARWELELEPLDTDHGGGGTRLWVRTELRVRRGTWHAPIFRLILTLTKGAQRGTDAYLRSLAGAETALEQATARGGSSPHR